MNYYDEILRQETAFEHGKLVSRISMILGEKTGMSDIEVARLGEAAKLHDVGKNFIPGEILLKPGELTEHEFVIVKKHTEIGFAHLVENIRIMFMAAIISLQHHEKADGTGYEKVTNIHAMAKLVAISDVFDALLAQRSYKRPWPPSEVIEYMRDNSGKHFEADYIEVLMNCLDEILVLYPQEIHSS